MNTKILSIVMLAGILIVGCETKTTNVDIRNDEGGAVMGLDYRDFDQTASDLVQSMLSSGALRKEGGGRYAIAKGRIVNDTMQRIDTDQLMVKIETEILNSGQGVFTAAIGPGTDELLQDVRQLRESDEFDQSTTPEKHTLIAPELTIAGKILQREVTVNRNTERAEYYFQLKLSDVKTGLTLWSDERRVVKQGSSRSVPW
jgi:uncharacterized protein (TIGR02722 family)